MQQSTFKPVKNLLSLGNSNAKTVKNDLTTFILYLAPANIALSSFNLCPFSSAGCRAACLYSAGRGRFSNVQKSRINKTLFMIEDPKSFYSQLLTEILHFNKRYGMKAEKIAIRLNGTSDIDHIAQIERFTGVNLLGPEFNNIHFYDYTKSAKIAAKYKGSNYKITFSRSEENEKTALEVLAAGGNIAAVFETLPDTWQGYQVINGDLTDLRYFDPVNVVVGLSAKGAAKKDKTGFVILNSQN